ncbi:MAG TPA: tetratricopeptide repeat protein [Ktedonosporobacter sp.]|jgi:tetratricopeptide (TPR) repeat protein/transcriptional regulator with XRE-family HTH domain|nr:tetratricopeptide repeat protein [Ktedonosporobacter sp.]
MESKQDKTSWSQWLKRQRALHGLTQQELAQKIGTTPLTVSRWERGIATPRSYSIRQLLALFDSNKEEFAREARSDDSIDATPAAFIYDPSIPPLPALTTGLVGRAEMLNKVKSWLCSHRDAFALQGMYGVGKTALAITLAHDRTIQRNYYDGILWIGVGPRPNLVGLLSRWGTLLGMPSHETASLTTIHSWQQAIHDAIGLRHMLLIIDDVWKAEDALAFKIGGPNCSHLITTRFREIAFHFGGANSITLTELNEEDSIQLLHALAPGVITSEMEAARELVRLVGGLPLALTIMGKHLQIQASIYQRRRVRRAIDRLHNVEERLQLTMLQSPLERSPSLDTEAHLSLQAAIEVSEKQMDRQASHALQALSVFPAKPNTFSEEAALAVCNVAGEVLDTLLDSGLIENGGQGRYTIHQTISHYALLRHTDRQAEERMVIFFVNFVQTHRENYEALERETENILADFQLACNQQLWTELIKGINAFVPFLQSRGAYSIAETYLTQAQQAAIALEDNTNLAVTYLHLGRIADLSGDYEKAEQFYQEGLNLARTVGQRETMSLLLAYWGEMLLNQGRYPQAEQCLQEGLLLAQALNEPLRISILFKNLGEVADSQGQYQQGNIYYQSGLHYARQVKNWEIMSALLQNLGSIETRYGHYEQAEIYLQEGLLYARKIGHQQRSSALLMNIGMVAFKRKHYSAAEKLYQQSLDIARKMNNPFRMGCVLQNLGMLERTHHHEQAAARYLQESLEIACKMKYNWLISETLCEWGELYLDQKKIDEACQAFEQALAKAHAMEAKELMAMSKFGLARIAYLQGNLTLAYQYGTESLQLFQNMEHEEANRVAQWLQQAFS